MRRVQQGFVTLNVGNCGDTPYSATITCVPPNVRSAPIHHTNQELNIHSRTGSASRSMLTIAWPTACASGSGIIDLVFAQGGTACTDHPRTTRYFITPEDMLPDAGGVRPDDAAFASRGESTDSTGWRTLISQHLDTLDRVAAGDSDHVHELVDMAPENLASRFRTYHRSIDAADRPLSHLSSARGALVDGSVPADARESEGGSRLEDSVPLRMSAGSGSRSTSPGVAVAVTDASVMTPCDRSLLPPSIFPNDEVAACEETVEAWRAFHGICEQVLRRLEEERTSGSADPEGTTRENPLDRFCRRSAENVGEEGIELVRNWLLDKRLISFESYVGQSGAVLGDSIVASMNAYSSPGVVNSVGAPEGQVTDYVIQRLLFSNPTRTDGSSDPPVSVGRVGYRDAFPYTRDPRDRDGARPRSAAEPLFLELLNNLVRHRNSVVIPDRNVDVMVTGLVGLGLHDAIEPCVAPTVQQSTPSTQDRSTIQGLLEDYQEPFCSRFSLHAPRPESEQRHQPCETNSMVCAAARELALRSLGGAPGGMLSVALGSDELLAMFHHGVATRHRSLDEFESDLRRLDHDTAYLRDLGVRRIFVSPPDVTFTTRWPTRATSRERICDVKYNDGEPVLPSCRDGRRQPDPHEWVCMLPSWSRAAEVDGRSLPRHVVLSQEACEEVHRSAAEMSQRIRRTLAVRSSGWLVLDTLLELPVLATMMRMSNRERCEAQPYDILSEDGQHPNTFGSVAWGELLVRALRDAGVAVRGSVSFDGGSAHEVDCDESEQSRGVGTDAREACRIRMHAFQDIASEDRERVMGDFEQRLDVLAARHGWAEHSCGEAIDTWSLEGHAYARESEWDYRRLEHELRRTVARVGTYCARLPGEVPGLRCASTLPDSSRDSRLIRSIFHGIGAGEANHSRSFTPDVLDQANFRVRASLAAVGSYALADDGASAGSRMDVEVASFGAGGLLPANYSTYGYLSLIPLWWPTFLLNAIPGTSQTRLSFARVGLTFDARWDMMQQSASPRSLALSGTLTFFHTRWYFDAVPRMMLTAPGSVLGTWEPGYDFATGLWHAARFSHWLRLEWLLGSGADGAFDVSPRYGAAIFVEPRATFNFDRGLAPPSLEIFVGLSFDHDFLQQRVFH